VAAELSGCAHADTPIRRYADTWLFRDSVPLAKLQINFQDVDQLLACQSLKRRRSIMLQDLVNLVADRCRIALGVVGPLRGYAVKLELGVCKGNLRVEARAGSRHQITGNIKNNYMRNPLAMDVFNEEIWSLEQLAEFKKFYSQPVAHFPRALLWHDPGKHKALTNLLRHGIRRNNFCECY